MINGFRGLSFLGGGSSQLNVHPVPRTTGETGLFRLGDLAGFGTMAGEGFGWSKSFTEHCLILGFVNARADLEYQQGLAREFSYRNRYDFYLPVFAHLGEQAVLNKEIYAQGTSADEDVFGYQERWSEMRFKNNEVTGLFRSDASGSLDNWTLTEDFASLPVLNESFIEDDPPIDRVISVPSEPHFKYEAWFDYKCTRPMPTYSVPGLMDHL